MPMRLGRLQRQSRRAFWASAAPEVFGGVLGETDANRKARALTLDPITTRNRQRSLSVAGYRRMVARAGSGVCPFQIRSHVLRLAAKRPSPTGRWRRQGASQRRRPT